MLNQHRLDNAVSIDGLIEAFRQISTLVLVSLASISLAISFWYIRAWIPSAVDGSHKDYVIWFDSLLTGTVPSVWFQAHLRFSFLDVFFRCVWFSYMFCLICGSAFFYCVKNEPARHLISVFLTLSVGLLIHYLLPTQPPWMAIDGVERIDGAFFTSVDKNLTAAMPSIHQAIICLAGCAMWKKGRGGKSFALLYNCLMAVALVYLGEHFVIDSAAGVILALCCWHTAKYILPVNEKKAVD
jgi:membrane-associated phospholipid phosphatase